MRSSFGNIIKLKNGNYKVRWSVNGQRRSKNYRSYKEATEGLARARLSCGHYDYSMTYSLYYYSAVKPNFTNLSERTIYQYNKAWELLELKIGNIKVAETNWRFIQNTINEYPSYTQQKRALELWRKILNFAVKDEVIPNNPTSQGIQLMKKNLLKANHTMYTKEDVGIVLNQISGTRYGLAVLLMCVCGLRLEEYCGLNRNDFDFGDEGWIYIYINQAVTSVDGVRVKKGVKTATSERTVALHKDFDSYLEQHFGWMANKRKLSDYLNPCSFNRNWKLYCKRNGVKYLPLGYMRSVYATLTAEAGCLDSVVSKAMGHMGSNIRERNYMSPTMQALKINASTLAEYINFKDTSNAKCPNVSKMWNARENVPK